LQVDARWKAEELALHDHCNIDNEDHKCSSGESQRPIDAERSGHDEKAEGFDREPYAVEA
jgi:hypothetical protein